VLKNKILLYLLIFLIIGSLAAQNISINKNRLNLIKSELKKLEKIKAGTEIKAKNVKDRLNKISKIKNTNLLKTKIIRQQKKKSKKNRNN